jgi:hypothetical protein
MVTIATSRALVVIFVPAALPAAVADRATSLTRQRLAEFCA